MIENIAIWGGFAGCIVAIFAIIILFLTRQSIISILNKDNILFDESFHMKKDAITSALALIDKLDQNGNTIKSDEAFLEEAKQKYNDLLCVLSDVRIADEFYNLTIEPTTPHNRARLAHFKLLCRKDIGLKIKKAEAVTRILKQANLTNNQPVQQAPIYQQMPAEPVQPQAPIQQEQPQVYTQPQQEPLHQTPQAPVQQSVAQPQSRPAQTAGIQQPMRPTQPRPMPQQMRPTQPRPSQPQPTRPAGGPPKS